MHGLDFQNSVVEEAISHLISGCGGTSPFLNLRPFKP